MSLPTKHIVHQGRVMASIAGTAFVALTQRFRPKAPLATPTPEIVEEIPALPADLVKDYVRHVGGDPAAYRGTLPAHLFPQWGFPLAARTLRGIPYPMQKVLNGGCRLEQKAPLPAGQPLVARATLADIDDDGRRAVLHQVVTTGTKDVPDALVAHMYAIVPLGGDKKEKREKKESVRVPDGARELAYFSLSQDAGLAFAMLTGDFNPVHWVKPYAKAFGFRSTILHGFSTMARAIEALNRARFAGAVDRLRTVDVKFTKPLVLPARVGVYQSGDKVWVGDAPSGPAYLAGSFEEK
jgi:acyl dehydratase